MEKLRFLVSVLVLSVLLIVPVFLHGNDKEAIDPKLKQQFDILADKSNEFPEEAAVEGAELLKKFTKPEDKKNRARVLRILGNAHTNLSNNRQALEYYEQALTIYRELGLEKGIGSVLNNVGLIRQDEGDYSGALKRFMEASDIFLKINEQNYLALSYTNIGNLYYTLGRYDKALDYLSKAVRISEISGDSTNMAMSYNNVGNVYLSLEDYAPALEFYNKAVAINKSLNRIYGLSTSYNNIAMVYEGQGEYKLALEHNRLSIELSRRVNDNEGIVLSLINTGNIYIAIDEFEQAEVSLMEAQRLSSSISSGYTKSRIQIGLGKLRLVTNHYDESINYYRNALPFALKVKANTQLLEIYKGLSEAWKGKGDYRRAYEHLELFTSITDSIYNEENNNRLNMLRVSFESENTERDNQLLKQQNIFSQLALKRQQTIRNLFIGFSVIVIVFLVILYYLYQSKNRKSKLLAERNEQIIRQKDELNKLYKEQFKLNETKNKFFSIVAHDLKSPFQTILGFSELLSSEYEYLSEEQRIESAANILKVSNEAFRLIENLLEWGRTQTGATHATFKLFNVREMVLTTTPVFDPQLERKKLKIVYDLPPLLQGWADPDMIMAVVRNVVSNAIKFSPIESQIEISARMSNNMIYLSISDHGEGIPEDILNRLFTLDPRVQRSGTMGEKGTGLGLTLCKEFMELNQGDIKANSEAGKGSLFTIIFQSVNSRNKMKS
jgi:signal transduction histidine kinase/predicted negative regulator of RcsB-dependent stress response